ncbi:MAG: hypothetical protein ACK2UK_08325 [Candidatus Promineifilaceae bacterium]
MPRKRDWTVRTIYFFAALTLGFVVSLGLLLLYFTLISPPGSAENVHPLLAPARAYLMAPWEGVVWPAGLTTGHLLLASFFLLNLILFLFARARTVRRVGLQPGAGCPACLEDALVRVHRHAVDRLLALSMVPLGRCRCLNCHWEGRRVLIGPINTKYMVEQNEAFLQVRLARRRWPEEIAAAPSEAQKNELPVKSRNQDKAPTSQEQQVRNNYSLYREAEKRE